MTDSEKLARSLVPERCMVAALDRQVVKAIADAFDSQASKHREEVEAILRSATEIEWSSGGYTIIPPQILTALKVGHVAPYVRKELEEIQSLKAEVAELKELLTHKGYLDEVWKRNEEIKSLHSALKIAKEALKLGTEVVRQYGSCECHLPGFRKNNSKCDSCRFFLESSLALSTIQKTLEGK